MKMKNVEKYKTIKVPSKLWDAMGWLLLIGVSCVLVDFKFLLEIVVLLVVCIYFAFSEMVVDKKREAEDNKKDRFYRYWKWWYKNRKDIEKVRLKGQRVYYDKGMKRYYIIKPSKKNFWSFFE